MSTRNLDPDMTPTIIDEAAAIIHSAYATWRAGEGDSSEERAASARAWLDRYEHANAASAFTGRPVGQDPRECGKQCGPAGVGGTYPTCGRPPEHEGDCALHPTDADRGPVGLPEGATVRDDGTTWDVLGISGGLWPPSEIRLGRSPSGEEQTYLPQQHASADAIETIGRVIRSQRAEIEAMKARVKAAEIDAKAKWDGLQQMTRWRDEALRMFEELKAEVASLDEERIMEARAADTREPARDDGLGATDRVDAYQKGYRACLSDLKAKMPDRGDTSTPPEKTYDDGLRDATRSVDLARHPYGYVGKDSALAREIETYAQALERGDHLRALGKRSAMSDIILEPLAAPKGFPSEPEESEEEVSDFEWARRVEKWLAEQNGAVLLSESHMWDIFNAGQALAEGAAPKVEPLTSAQILAQVECVEAGMPDPADQNEASLLAAPEVEPVDESPYRPAEAGLSTPEPPPRPTGGRSIWELVIEDMQQRDQDGRRKYGVPLQAGNGRRPLVDAYQEALDMAVYLRQAIEEAADVEAVEDEG